MSTTQKEKIVSFIIDFIALEGAKEHFGAELPATNQNIEKLYQKILVIGFPGEWDETQYIYDYTGAHIPSGTHTEMCWHCLKTIRNNLFHANKAKRPDIPKRLTELLDLSNSFMKELNKGENEIGQHAKAIREKLQID